MDKFNSFSLCVILAVFGLTRDTGGQTRLPNACHQNQFRCAGGTKCLTTERLCNGRKDCPEGDDETGNTQWDCTKIALSTLCDPLTEVKCRYGGCIKREKICDGQPDCWGATDEAIEDCQGIDQQENLNSNQSSMQTISGDCLPIKEDPSLGFDVRCSHFNKPIDCTVALPNGAIATYRCKKYYSPPRIGSSVTQITCENGMWSKRRQSFTCDLRCGLGGLDNVILPLWKISSKRGKWPWHVAMYHEDPQNSTQMHYFCGGSLISDRAILTAANRLYSISNITREPQSIRAVLGKFLWTYQQTELSEQDIVVSKIDIHEDFNYFSQQNDIAIIWLEKKVEINDYVRPVCLPDGSAILEPDLDQGRLVGWEKKSDGSFNENLQEMNLPIVSAKTCRDAHSTLNFLVRPATFCAGYLNGTSACKTDSGIGLVFIDNDNTKLWQVQGITSSGVRSLEQSDGCNNKYYTVFTRVSKFVSWIKNKLDQNY